MRKLSKKAKRLIIDFSSAAADLTNKAIRPNFIQFGEARAALMDYIAELEEEQVILKDQQREAKNILIDKNLHIDSLYEEGYKLQQRIAELEKDNDEFRQLIHDWIIILTPDDGYVPDSECVRQAMLVIDKEREE